MSFKREGNDSSLLSKLRKRRVDELLGEGIPDDEAKLLSNGRLTCTVCNSIPIFDTLNMLMIHRSGKKHLANLQIHDSKKRELKHLIAVRKHQQFLKDGTTSIPVASSSLGGGVLLSKPYDPRVKKAKLRATDRKPCVNLEAPSEELNFPSDPYKTDISTTSVLNLPGNSKPSTLTWQDIAQKQISGPVIHDRQLKRLCGSSPDSDDIIITPYQGKRRQGVEKRMASASAFSVRGCESPSQSQYHSSHFSQTVGANSSVMPQRQPCLSDLTLNPKNSSSLVPPPPPPPPPPPQLPAPTQQDSPQPCDANSLVGQSEKNPQQSDIKALSTKGTTVNNGVAQRLRQLQGSGWKRDWDGKWIKDEDAEFDSDEEPPDIP